MKTFGAVNIIIIFVFVAIIGGFYFREQREARVDIKAYEAEYELLGKKLLARGVKNCSCEPAWYGWKCEANKEIYRIIM